MQRVGGHFLVISPSHFKTSATNKNKKFYTLALLQIFTLYLPIFLNILVLYSSTVGTQVLLRVTAYLCIVVSCCVQECTQRYKKNVQNKLRAVFPEKIQDQLACNVILVSVWNQYMLPVPNSSISMKLSSCQKCFRFFRDIARINIIRELPTS